MQTLNGRHDFVVDARIGGLQVVPHRLEATFWPFDELTPDHGFGVGLAHEGAGAAYHNLFQQVEERDARLVVRHVAAGVQKEAIQVADARTGEVAAVAPGYQRQLVVQVEDVVVDGRRRQQNELLAAAFPPSVPVGADDALQALVALGGAIPEVVGLVNQDDVGVAD